MEAFLIIVLFVVVVIPWFVTTGRIDKIEDRFFSLTGERPDRQQIINLTQRVHALESELQRLRSQPAPGPVVEPKPAVVQTPVEVPPPLPVPLPVAVPQPRPWVPPSTPWVPPSYPAPAQRTEPAFVPPRVEAAQTAAPTMTQSVREKVGGKDWEATVGGNWFLKVGVILTVIGIALFLAYSFAHMGPAGRVSVSLAVSLTMLIAGVIVERWEIGRAHV